MPYENRSELPESVQRVLPAHAQDIYQKAFNSAWDQYDTAKERGSGNTREGVSHRVAWSAVNQKYAKGGDGKWHSKS